MSERKAYVIGAGLAGLAAALGLSSRGFRLEVFEAAAQAGGRCRSYLDPVLGQVIDNGNHLVLSGNRAVNGYLKRIGAQEHLQGPSGAEYCFADVKAGARWRIAPNDGALPWWICARDRRVPQTSAADYLGFAALLLAHPGKRIKDVIACKGRAWELLMRPLLLAALNTEPAEAAADLAGAVLRETLAKGGAYCRPRIAAPTLSACFIDPAVARLTQEGAPLSLGRRLQRIEFAEGGITAIVTAGERITLGAADIVVLATPPWVSAGLVPDLQVPDDFRSIVNAHFKCAPPQGAPAIMGLIGGTAEWVFAFPDRIATTVSGADAIVDEDREALARRIWSDVSPALGLSSPMPVWQIVKERRATFAATPEQAAKRPGPRTRWRNLFLAGDWTNTGLPATIEGALRSGNAAAEAVLQAKAA